MMNLAVQIVRYLEREDAPQPGLAEAEFVDAEGRRHTLVDKIPIFTAEYLDAASTYPQTGVAACEILARWQDVRKRELVRISTAHPYDIESTEGISEFVVLSTQLS